jgi:hypothetical protein
MLDLFRQLEQAFSEGRGYRDRIISLEAHHYPMGSGSSVKVYRLARVNGEDVIPPRSTLATLDRRS